MELPDLYPAQVGSPYTTLAAPYTTGEATMTVVNATKLPDAPNIVCLAGSVAGEFRYSGKDGNTLLGVAKLPGTPNATWPTGTFAFRGVSAYDHNALIEYAQMDRPKRGAYDAIVYKSGTSVIAEDATGATIASGTAGTDDATVIQAAIDSLRTDGLLLVRGSFVIDSELLLDKHKYLDLTGSRFDNSPNTGYCFKLYIGATSYARDIHINGGTITGGGGGICLLGAKQCTLSNIKILNCNIGLDIDGANSGTWYNTYSNIITYRCSDKGVYIHTSGTGRSINATFFGGEIRANGTGICIESGNGHNFHGVIFEANTTDIYTEGLMSLYGCRLENSGRQSISIVGDGKLFVYEGRSTGAYITGWDEHNYFYTRMDGIVKFRQWGTILHASAFETLQACIDSLSGGEIVYLSKKIYSEALTIPPALKSVTFIGAGGVCTYTPGGPSIMSYIDGGTTGPALTISGDGQHVLKFIGIGFRTTAGSGNAYPAVKITGAGSGYVEFDGCVFGPSDDNGLHLYMAGHRKQIVVKNCIFETIDGDGIHASATTPAGGPDILYVDGCRFANVGNYGISLYRANVARVTNNIITSTGYSVVTTANVVDGYVAGNVVSSAMSISGTSTVLHNNTGYVTESKGTATLLNATTSIVVAHGCSATPTNITVTPGSIGNATKWWVDTIGGTNFTIHVDQDPGADITFYWKAEV